MYLHVGLVLAAEGTTNIRRDDAHHALRHIQCPCNLHPVAVRRLAGGIDSDPTVIANQPNASFRLEKRVFRPLSAIGVLDHHICGRDRRLNIPRSVHFAHHDVVFTVHDLIGTGFHCLQRIEDARQHLILDFDRLQRCISRQLVQSSNRGNRVSLKTNFIDNQKRLIRFRIQVTVFSRNVSVRNHGVDARHFSCLADIELSDSRSCMRAVQKFAAKQSWQLNVRTIPGFSGHNLFCARCCGPLADDGRFSHSRHLLSQPAIPPPPALPL